MRTHKFAYNKLEAVLLTYVYIEAVLFFPEKPRPRFERQQEELRYRLSLPPLQNRWIFLIQQAHAGFIEIPEHP